MFGKLSKEKVKEIFDKLLDPPLKPLENERRKCIYCGKEIIWAKDWVKSKQYFCTHCWRNFIWEKNQQTLEESLTKSS